MTFTIFRNCRGHKFDLIHKILKVIKFYKFSTLPRSQIWHESQNFKRHWISEFFDTAGVTNLTWFTKFLIWLNFTIFRHCRGHKCDLIHKILKVIEFHNFSTLPRSQIWADSQNFKSHWISQFFYTAGVTNLTWFTKF